MRQLTAKSLDIQPEVLSPLQGEISEMVSQVYSEGGQQLDVLNRFDEMKIIASERIGLMKFALDEFNRHSEEADMLEHAHYMASRAKYRALINSYVSPNANKSDAEAA